MYNETKLAVKKAFDISKRLFFMGYENYMKLLNATAEVVLPTEEDLSSFIESGLSMEDAVIAYLREKYKEVAVSIGFTEDQGLAILEYAAMLEEIKNE